MNHTKVALILFGLGGCMGADKTLVTEERISSVTESFPDAVARSELAEGGHQIVTTLRDLETQNVLARQTWDLETGEIALESMDEALPDLSMRSDLTPVLGSANVQAHEQWRAAAGLADQENSGDCECLEWVRSCTYSYNCRQACVTSRICYTMPPDCSEECDEIVLPDGAIERRCREVCKENPPVCESFEECHEDCAWEEDCFTYCGHWLCRDDDDCDGYGCC